MVGNSIISANKIIFVCTLIDTIFWFLKCKEDVYIWYESESEYRIEFDMLRYVICFKTISMLYTSRNLWHFWSTRHVGVLIYLYRKGLAYEMFQYVLRTCLCLHRKHIDLYKILSSVDGIGWVLEYIWD